ncbi:MAG: nuclear transport factor 2 family protein [Bacteroidota bacterium]
MIKSFFATLILLIPMMTMAQTQTQAQYQAVSAAVEAFAQAADQQDAEALDKILDDNFRLVMNQLFGGDKVMTMDKATYLGKIRNKEFGGDERTVSIHAVNVYGKNAQAQATFKGKKMTFTSYLQLIHAPDGSWKIVNDLPTVE